MVKFQVRKLDADKVMVEFECDGALEPGVLKNLQPPDPVKEGFANYLVVLSGRAPVWLYAYLVHFYHPTKAVATYDPRLGGAVVVQSHVRDYEVGDIVKF